MPSLNWIGKEKIVNHDKDVPFRLLRKNKKYSLGNSGNLILEGDNLEALKALMPFYYGKVKCIYIDPPYNTGNEKWVFNDKVNSPKIKEWLGKVVGPEGEDLTRHDKWLCMMYPRLKLLRDLLNKDGVIFVSIDDNEQSNLKMIMDDIFFPENFIGNIVVKSTPGGRQSSRNLVSMGDYILAYGKSNDTQLSGLPLSQKYIDQYKREDKKGKFLTERLRQHGVAEKREDVPTLYFPIYYDEKENRLSTAKKKRYNIEVLPILPDGGDGRWIWSKQKVERDKELIEIRKVKRNGGYIYDAFFKKYLSDELKAKMPNIWIENDFRTEIGTKELKEVFAGRKVFVYPKPVNTIRRLLMVATSENDIVLDSFAGSGTTAHAVLDLNKEDGGNRKFILVELEKNIAKNITAERVKRVARGYSYKTNAGKVVKVPGLGGSFEYAELGPALFSADGNISEKVSFEEMASYVYFTETLSNIDKRKIKGNFIGEYNDIEYYLLFKKKGENILNRTALKAPIVCIKIPTGGGKTLIASYSVGVLFETFLKERGDRGSVMWFVPSDPIRKQTLRALKNRDHDYRKALDARFDNKVKVFDIEEAKKIKKDDISDNICIIVSTISAFRREERDKLKVFQNNGSLLEHFDNLPEEAKEFLKKDKSGEVIYSLANVIRLHNPLTVVDEGHNINTELSLQMLEVLNPSFILEFTATPRKTSNILVEVGAQALKDQKMIKMPILLHPVAPWQETIFAGIKKRQTLERSAKKNATGYIRPLMLIQAEQEKESKKRVYVEQIKNFLIHEGKVLEREIAIKTAKQDTLPDAEVLSNEKCPVKYIITVNALREGWDCPFAYILVSVSNLGAALSVEQTIGRIMRLPYVREHKDKQLNQAYIFVSTNNFTQTAEKVIEALKQNGYDNIVSIQGGVTVEAKSYEKRVKDKIAIPFINIKNKSGRLRKIGYVEDVLGEQKLLQSAPTSINLALPKESKDITRIDVGHEGQLVKEKGGSYSVVYHPEVNTKEGLIAWLRFRIQREFITMKEIDDYLKRLFNVLVKKFPAEKLSVARYSLKESVDSAIDSTVDLAAKKHFDALEKRRVLKTGGEVFEFGEEIIFTTASKEPFEKHAYEKAAGLNREELQFAKKIDALPNVKWWLRNPENSGFGIQGWKRNKFYPDFFVKTVKGMLLAIEYKGGFLATGEDTDYKKELGNKWAKLSGGKCKFYLVEKKNIDKMIAELANL